MKVFGRKLLPLILILFCCHSSTLEKKVLRIYHDSDYSNHKESAISMKMGFLTALDEVNNSIQGYQIQLLEKDHRGNSIRSKLHMQQYLNDSQALMVLGGLHSPPYIRFRDFINSNEVLLLVPWAAGAPITRYDKGPNWVFRLSVDDAKAGYKLSQFATNTLNCQSPHLLLEDTPWGKSNQRNMTQAFKEKTNKTPAVTWFNWNIKHNAARIMLRNILSENTDCILFVANSIEGEVFVRAMASMENSIQVPIVSHWGITGGDFQKRVTADIREKVKLYFIQSCFSFISSSPTKLSESVLSRAKKLFPEKIKTKHDIQAPPGFVHSFDLGRIVIQAMQNIKLTGEIKNDRAALRKAMELVKQSVPGLIKTYSNPFTKWSPETPDAHEALGIEDYCMAEFTEDGHVKLRTSASTKNGL